MHFNEESYFFPSFAFSKTPRTRRIRTRCEMKEGSAFHVRRALWHSTRNRARGSHTCHFAKQRRGARDIAYRHATRRALVVRHVEFRDAGRLARLAVRGCRSTFPVLRRALFSAWRGYWRNDVPPIHPAMTFKYFRTRCGVSSLLRARDAREKLADVRWMRNRALSLLSVFPKLAPVPRREKLCISTCLRARVSGNTENPRFVRKGQYFF